MANTIWMSPIIDYWATSLVSGINSTATILLIGSPASGVTAPGVLVLDRKDASGNKTPTLREYISFTTINKQELSGLTRAVGGSATLSHGAGTLIESAISSTHWMDMIGFTGAEHDASGRHVISTATVNYTETIQLALTSIASIAVLQIKNLLNLSGASIAGVTAKIKPQFRLIGSISGPTSTLQTPMVMPDNGSFQWATMTTRTVASGASAIIDILKNGTSIFNTATRPTIPGGGTFVSTASLATKAFNQGDLINWNFTTSANVGMNITDIDILLST